MFKIEVQEYGLFQFMMKVQELYEEGYRLNFEKNEDVPMSYGTLFVANMYLPAKVESLPFDTEVVPTVEPVIEAVVETVVPDVGPAVTPSVSRKTAKAKSE